MFIIGICYGVKELKIKFTYNVIISLIAGLGTHIALIFGNVLKDKIDPLVACLLSGGLLIFLGVKMLISAIKNTKKSFYDKFKDSPNSLDINNSGNIETFEIIILAVVLAVNNVGLGISGGAIGLSFTIIPLLSIACSIIFLWLGYKIGLKCKKIKGINNMDIFSSIVIILLGIYTLIH